MLDKIFYVVGIVICPSSTWAHWASLDFEETTFSALKLFGVVTVEERLHRLKKLVESNLCIACHVLYGDSTSSFEIM